jgi:streptolysin S family bacteriocin protoxin
MPQHDDLSEIQNKIARLESKLGIPRKIELAKQATASAQARQKALQLPDTSKSQNIARLMSRLADRNDVLVEWNAHEIEPGAEPTSCCCCCCCCQESSLAGPVAE